jgi:hypothetical protein
MTGLPPQALDCLKDRWWRLNNLYWVIDEHGRRVVFKPNWAQTELFSTMGYKNLDLKVRQIGITTGYCILWLDLCFFSPNQAVGIVAHTKNDVSLIMKKKILYAYNCLPEELKAANPLIIENAEELGWANGSNIRAGVTFRSGTVQVLHVTEFGYICQHFPARAQEVVTGSMQSVHEGSILVIESTAKGRAGYFYDYCQNAQKPGSDWTFRFLPWFKEPEYRKSVDRPIEYKAETDYLDELQLKLSITLDPAQRQWWCDKRRTLGDDVFSEYPSTPEEAFRASTEGAYYGQQMLTAAREGRITKVPPDRALLVDTWWDLGMSDSTTIWFVQPHGYEIRIIDYYENTGEGLPHYAQYLQQWSVKHACLFGKHIAPHDIKVRELGSGKSRLDTAAELGINFHTVPALPVIDGIERVRATLSRCIFDEERCSEGIKALEHYRKEWNANLGTYKTQPLHDWASHGSDAFRTGIVGMDAGMVGVTARRRSARPVQRNAWR